MARIVLTKGRGGQRKVCYSLDSIMAVEARLRVIYGDTDQMGVVYYANYFRYFELARGEYFRARGGSYVEMEREGRRLPVFEASCNYRAPARYDDVLIIKVEVTDLRRASLVFQYEVRKEGDDAILCTGQTSHACINFEGRPTALPEQVVRLLKPA
jgi:acyl-CoA thioester hydrolase